MKTKTPFRPWREINILDRVLRILTYVGFASFTVFWFISVYVGCVASAHPFASGLFQCVYAFKGRIGYIDDSQRDLANFGNYLAFGWGIAFAAGMWGMYNERKAQRGKDVQQQA